MCTHKGTQAHVQYKHQIGVIFILLLVLHYCVNQQMMAVRWQQRQRRKRLLASKHGCKQCMISDTLKIVLMLYEEGNQYVC